MTDGSVSTRWWENYLVRYFLPSLAGMLIIYWLLNNTSICSFIPPFIPKDFKDFGTAHLVLWLLLGSLYCYLASYPALVFHATRVIDFRNVNGQMAKFRYVLLNPYALSVGFTIWEGSCAYFDHLKIALVGLILYAGAQVLRLFLIRKQGPFGFKDGFESSIAYAYLKKLSKRRSIDTTTEEDNETTTKSDAKDMVDSYRHLREHGNTALIVLLEIGLCPLIYLALVGQNQLNQCATLTFVLILWILPSVLIHGTAQHLERRFSRFRYSLQDRGKHCSEREDSAIQKVPRS